MNPTRYLIDPDPLTQHRYVPAHLQSEQGLLATWRWMRGSENPNNYPAEQVAEKQGMQIRSDRG